jgi:hypothetical protein
MTQIEIMKQAYATHYRGSITELIENQMIAQEQIENARVPESQAEAEIGLSDGSAPPMLLENPGVVDMTQMDKSLDMALIKEDTGLVSSFLNDVQPGEIVQTGEGIDVLEMSDQAKLRNGGYIRSKASEGMRKYKFGGRKKC